MQKLEELRVRTAREKEEEREEEKNKEVNKNYRKGGRNFTEFTFAISCGAETDPAVRCLMDRASRAMNEMHVLEKDTKYEKMIPRNDPRFIGCVSRVLTAQMIIRERGEGNVRGPFEQAYISDPEGTLQKVAGDPNTEKFSEAMENSVKLGRFLEKSGNKIILGMLKDKKFLKEDSKDMEKPQELKAPGEKILAGILGI